MDIVRERGLLLEKNVIELLGNFRDIGKAKEFLVNIERISGQKMITMGLLEKNFEFVDSVVKQLPAENKSIIENTFVKLGLHLEVKKVSQVVEGGKEDKRKKEGEGFRIFYADTKPERKIEVKDFTNHFRGRYVTLQRILMERPELQQNLVSINKIGSDRQSLSIIGIVTEKRITKNKNLIIKFEDLTGEISCLVKPERTEVFEKASELQLDDIVGVKASGDRSILFIHDILYPESIMFDRVKFDEDVSAVFLSDVHCGSDRHLTESFERFLEWLNSDDEIAGKIKYIFFSGDNVDGVGIFPGQEEVLKLKSMKEQYALLSSYLRKVPKRITMFMCPGQHDATRVAEPQPIIDRRYGGELYEIENLVLVTNPCMVKLLEGEKEFKVLMYHGASMHSFVSEIKELRDMGAYRNPAKIARHMLKRRHLAPTHGAVVYIPASDRDPMAIAEVPHVLCTGEVHHLDIENYNGVLIIIGSCWQARTPFEEKVGNIPDPCKVPILNLKTREVKVYDFGLKEEIEKWM